MKNTRSLIYASLCVLVWSFIPVISRLGQTSIDIYQFLLMSNIFSTLSVGLCIFPNRRNIRENLREINIVLSVSLGFFGCFFYYLCLYYGYASSENTTTILVVQYLWPGIVFILAIFILGEKISLRSFFAISLGFSATVLVIFRSTDGELNLDLFPILIVFIGAISFSLFSIFSKFEKCNSASICVFLYFLWASLFSFIAFILFGEWQQPDTNSFYIIIINGVLVNGVSYILWKSALSNAKASLIAPLVYFAPILSMVWIKVILNEEIGLLGLISIALIILSGLLLINAKDQIE